MKHKKDLLVPTKGICGAGYSYPSTITLLKTWEGVNCIECLKKQKEMHDRITN